LKHDLVVVLPSDGEEVEEEFLLDLSPHNVERDYLSLRVRLLYKLSEKLVKHIVYPVGISLSYGFDACLFKLGELRGDLGQVIQADH
jgi:hypothetical protein